MSSRYFPFHAIGLRCNPFRALVDEEWAEVAILPELMQAVLVGGFVHLQILGAIGHGKTTTLLGLLAHFTRAERRVDYEYLPDGQRHFRADIDNLDVFLLDEAERLSAGERDRLLAGTACAVGRLQLVCGSHADLTPLFARHGLPLMTVRLNVLTAGHMDTVLTRRLAYFSLTGVPPVDFTPDALAYLWERFGGNLRATERFLYEVFQQLRPAGALTAEQLERAALLIALEVGP